MHRLSNTLKCTYITKNMRKFEKQPVPRSYFFDHFISNGHIGFSALRLFNGHPKRAMKLKQIFPLVSLTVLMILPIWNIKQTTGLIKRNYKIYKYY